MPSSHRRRRLNETRRLHAVGVVGVNQALESGTVKRCVERLRVDAAAFDLQLSLPGVDHLKTA